MIERKEGRFSEYMWLDNIIYECINGTRTARTNMYMSHTIRMIDVLYLPRCNSLLAHSTCLGLGSTIVIMYMILLLILPWIDLWRFERLKSLLWSLTSAYTTSLTKFGSIERKNSFRYTKFYAIWLWYHNVKKIVTWVPKCELFDLNGTQNFRYIK